MRSSTRSPSSPAQVPASAMRRPSCSLKEGAKVVVSGRRQAELDALVAEIEKAGGQADCCGRRREGREACPGSGRDRGRPLWRARHRVQQRRFEWRDGTGSRTLTRRMARYARHQPDQCFPRREVPGAGDDQTRWRLDRVHLEFCRQYGRLPWHGRLCRRQGGTGRSDTGARRGVRCQGHSCECHPSGWHRHACESRQSSGSP